MLQNEPLVAKIGVDTAENEPIFGWTQLVQLSRFNSSILSLVPGQAGQTLEGPLSAVSTPIFAAKEPFSFRLLPLKRMLSNGRGNISRLGVVYENIRHYPNPLTRRLHIPAAGGPLFKYNLYV